MAIQGYMNIQGGPQEGGGGSLPALQWATPWIDLNGYLDFLTGSAPTSNPFAIAYTITQNGAALRAETTTTGITRDGYNEGVYWTFDWTAVWPGYVDGLYQAVMVADQGLSIGAAAGANLVHGVAPLAYITTATGLISTTVNGLAMVAQNGAGVVQAVSTLGSGSLVAQGTGLLGRLGLVATPAPGSFVAPNARGATTYTQSVLSGTGVYASMVSAVGDNYTSTVQRKPVYFLGARTGTTPAIDLVMETSFHVRFAHVLDDPFGGI